MVTINNSFINTRSFLTETNLADSKKVKYGDITSDTNAMTDDLIDALIKILEQKQLKNVTSILDKTVPELSAPKYSNQPDFQNDELEQLVNELEDLLKNLDDTTGKAQKSEYTQISESAFASLYAKLLELFASLNVTSATLTAIHASLAEKLAKSSGDHLISAAEAQRNQAIVSAVTTMSVGGAGLAIGTKGINQQQKALKQGVVSNELNSVNNSLNHSITNGSNVSSNTVTGSPGERVGQSILNNNSIMSSANQMESELLKLAGNKNTNTGHIVGTMGQSAGGLVSSGYSVESASDNADSQMDNVAKENMIETESKNRENQNAARNTLKAILDLIYQAMEKNNEAVSHTAQMIKS